MGIDLTKLRTSDSNKGDVKDVLDEVFADSASMAPKVTPVEKEEKPDKSNQDTGYIGDMLYNGQQVKVNDQIDKDGYTWVDDGKGLIQVKAKDLKGLDSITTSIPAPSSLAFQEKTFIGPEQSVFWGSYLGDLIERMGAGASDFGGSMYSLADKVDKVLSYIDPVGGFISKSIKQKFEKEHPGQEYKTWLQKQAQNSYNYAETLRKRSDRYQGKDFSTLYDEDRYGDMVGEVFLTASESLPQSVTAMMGGGVGLALTGASAGTQKYDQLDKMPETKDLPEYRKIINAVATGTFEAFSEKIGDIKIGQELARTYRKIGVEAAAKKVEDEVSAWMGKQFKKYGLLWSPVAEGIEEVASQIAENITDYATGVTDEYKPMDGILSSFVYGAAGGAQFTAMGIPGVTKNHYDRFKSRKDYEKAREQVKNAFPGEDDVHTFTQGLTYLSPAEQERVIGTMARSGNIDETQTKTLVDFTNVANRYKSYKSKEANEKERQEGLDLAVSGALRKFDEGVQEIASEDGKIQQIELIGREDEGDKYIIKGQIEVEQEGENYKILPGKTSPELYYLDRNGEMQVVSPDQVNVKYIGDVAEIRSEYRKRLLGELEQQEDPIGPASNQPSPSVNAKVIENGDRVYYKDKNGRNTNGIVSDAFSNDEYIFLEDGTEVERNRVISNESVSEYEQKADLSISEESENYTSGENETEPPILRSYEIEKGLTATEQADGSYRLNVEFTKTDLAEGQKLVVRLNNEYKEDDLSFQLVELPKVQPDNRFEKKRFGVVVVERSSEQNSDNPTVGEQQTEDKSIISKEQENKNDLLLEPVSSTQVISNLLIKRFTDIKRNFPDNLIFIRDSGKYIILGEDALQLCSILGIQPKVDRNGEKYWVVGGEEIEAVIQRVISGGRRIGIVEDDIKSDKRKIKSERQSVGRYIERDKALGPYLSVRDELLRGIATGRFRFVWNDKDIKRGISKELGLVESEKERRRRVWMFNNSGYSVDGLAHYLSESPDSPAYQRETEDIRNEIIDVMNTYDTPSEMMEMAEAMRLSAEDRQAAFVASLTNEELDWYDELQALRQEMERELPEDMPEVLQKQFLQEGITENQLINLQNIDNLIKFVEHENSDNEGEISEPGTDSGNLSSVESRESESQDEGGIASAIVENEESRRSKENPLSDESSGYDVLTNEEKQVVFQASAQIDAQISDLERRLKNKSSELRRKKAELGQVQAERGQMKLFEEDQGLADGELFEVKKDLSESNLSKIVTPLSEEVKVLQNEIRRLKERKNKVVNEALDAYRRQGKLFEEITREDIEACDADEQLKDMAIDYLSGEDSTVNRVAYLSIKNRIENDRNRPKHIERDSKNGGVDTPTHEEVFQSGLSEQGESGRSNISDNVSDSRTGDREVQSTRIRPQIGGQNDNPSPAGKRINKFSSGDGKRGFGKVSGETSGNTDTVDSMQSRRSRGTVGDGKERGDSSGSEVSDNRGNEPVNERKNNPETNRKSDLDAELAAALAEFDEAVDLFKEAGKSSLNLSLVGLTNEQIEAIGDIIAKGAKVGHVLLKQGIYSLQEWAHSLKNLIGEKLKSHGLADADVDELIREMWNTKVRDAEGNRKKISVLAKEYQVRPKDVKVDQIPTSFVEKMRISKEKQKAAEAIPVEWHDVDNIRETLPMLLPEQQDDVVKSEKRFFTGERKKGILFTNGTGTGKTYTGLGIIKRFAKQGKDNILIVVPSSEKVKDWADDGRNLLLNITPLLDTKDKGQGIVVTTYANFRENRELWKRDFDLVVYDECHRIMESKDGNSSITTSTHFTITNKDEFYTVRRLIEFDPDYQRFLEIRHVVEGLREQAKGEKEEERKKIVKKIENLQKEQEECQKRYLIVEEALRKEAKQYIDRTKVVFLSATPFKTVFNLRYADGYLFDFPEQKYTGYNVPSGENLFYIENFGAQFRMRYNRLETKGKDLNPEAVAMQEIQFQQKLTQEGAMSGRAIESNRDYSREFVKPHSEDFDNELFNNALNAIYDYEENRYSGLRNAAGEVFFNYQYSTRLMETLKTSMFIPRIEQHIALGRKVVLFHRRKQANVQPPFRSILSVTETRARANLNRKDVSPDIKEEAKSVLKQCDDFRSQFQKLLEYEQTLNYRSAIDQIVENFGNQVKLFNGDISKQDKSLAVKEFNDDNSGVNIIVIQEESGKEGISLHDRTGKHPRVLMSLSSPISSITALQIEGRIYRIGQESDAIFEYPTLGLDSEMILFSQTINRKLSTTENLALGDSARDLITSFAEGISNWTDEEPSLNQGVGGKKADQRVKSVKSPYEMAVLTYFTNQKITKKRNNRQGIDYFPTPEPLGQKLVEWTGIQTGEWLLEPSAGHGAIAMWVPQNCGVTAIEPSFSLFARLGGKVSNGNLKLLNTTFEEHDLINKYAVIAMNPPFGSGGATAIIHIEKAFRHLKNAGRLVAIIPNGGSMAKKFENFLYGFDSKGKPKYPEAQLAGEVILPGCVFEQAGTTVFCRVVVIDKVGEGAVSHTPVSKRIDLSFCKDIKEFFEHLEGVTMPDRATLTDEELKKQRQVEGEELSGDRYLEPVVKTKHKRTKKFIFVVEPTYNVDSDTFKIILERAKGIKGNWDKRLKKFVFQTVEAAEAFREYVNRNMGGESNGLWEGRPILNEESTEVPDDLLSSVTATKHTKTGKDIFYVSTNYKVSDAVYEEIVEVARQYRGGWSKFLQGFAFSTSENAEAFRNSVSGMMKEDASDPLLREIRNSGSDEVTEGIKVRFRKEVERLERSLNVAVNVVENKENLPERLQRKNKRYSGIFDPATGDVYLILNEIQDMAEVQRTVYHEVVGHKGIRGVFGNYLTDFTEQVLAGMDEQTRQSWIKECKGDRQLAAEEYVAGFAEHYYEPSAWQKVKGVVRELLRRLGVDLRLNDSDLQYILWRGVKRIQENDSVMDIVEKSAKDEAMYREVEEENKALEKATELDISREDKIKYHNEIVSRRFLFLESYQDRLLSVKKLQELVEKKAGEKLPIFMNAYLFENTLASRNTYELEYFRNNQLRQMTDAIAGLEKRGMKRRKIENYIMLKHGLERNEYMRDKLVTEWYEPKVLALEGQKHLHSDEWFQREMMLLDEEKALLKKRLSKADFSGVRAIASELEAESKTVNSFIAEIEKDYKMEVADLWKSIKICTEFALHKWFESGMINRQRLDKIKGMFKNYVPLRGFDEVVASDVYEYFTEENGNFNSPLREAKGRRSRPDNPFAFIVSIAESAVVGGNKNLMKLHFFRMAQKYPSGLLSTSKIWYKEVGIGADGKKMYEAVLPEYSDDVEVYRENVEQFNEEMRQLQAEEKAFRSRKSLKVGYKLLGDEQVEHRVKVFLNGEEFAVLMHGDPRPAQAIEGLNDEERIDNRIISSIRWLNRQMAANFTTRNPAFIASNLTRDLIFSITMLGVKEGGKYRNEFVRNIPQASGAIRRYLQGKASPGNRIDEYFAEFIKNGGETGYTVLYNLDKFKRMIDVAVREEVKPNQVAKITGQVLDFFAAGNRWAEDLARFSVYVTSREAGRSVLQCVSNAKEVTVNFNRKGSGANGCQVFKSLFIFFNAAVQSLANLYNVMIYHPAKTARTLAGVALAGVIVPLLLRVLGGDDAEEEYLNLPDYVRKNSLCIYTGKGFVTLPLPIELRAFFGLGDAAYRYFRGNTDGVTVAGEVVTGMLDVLPLNPAGGNVPFVPDAFKPLAQAFYVNRNFAGRPIAKVTEYNHFDPEFRKVYKGTGAMFVRESEIRNYFSGGDYATRGKVDEAGQMVSDLLGMKVYIVNPAADEHVLEEYLGGMYKTIQQAFKTIGGLYDMARTGDDSGFALWNVPVLNRFYNVSSDFNRAKRINDKYYKALNELKETENRLRKYKEAMKNGKIDLEEGIKRYSEMAEDGSFERAKIMRYYMNEVVKLDAMLRISQGLSDEERAELEQEILLIKENMLSELKSVIK